MSLDRLAFGAERSALLGSLVADSSVPPLTICAPDGELRGYALARQGAVACYVGPIVATDQNAAASLLDSLIAESLVPPLTISGPDSELQGYALAREGTVSCYVGPIVATDQSAAASLLDGMLAQLDGRDVLTDLNTTFEAGAQIVGARGFVKQRDFTRMGFGMEHNAGTSPLIFAIAGPEVG